MSITRFAWDGDFGANLAEIAVRADETRIHSLWAMDHLWQIPYNGPETEPMLECYTVLPYLAGITRQVQLGAMVTAVSYRPPGILVKALTTLDVLSGGRAWLGIGAAWNADEAAGLGLPFPPLRQRYRQLEETLQLAGRMWSGDESGYDGEEFELARPLNSPGPVRPGGPPILIGGSGEKRTLRLVAQYADACNLFYTGDLDAVRHSLGVLRRHCDEVGRDYDEIVKSVAATVPPDSRSDLERLAEAGVDLVVMELPGTDAAAVEPLAAAAEAAASYGRPSPPALQAVLPRAA